MDYKEGIKLFKGLTKEQKIAFAINVFVIFEDNEDPQLFEKVIEVAKRY